MAFRKPLGFKERVQTVGNHLICHLVSPVLHDNMIMEHSNWTWKKIINQI